MSFEGNGNCYTSIMLLWFVLLQRFTMKLVNFINDVRFINSMDARKVMKSTYAEVCLGEGEVQGTRNLKLIVAKYKGKVKEKCIRFSFWIKHSEAKRQNKSNK